MAIIQKSFDAIVVGGGGAGLRAALQLAKQGGNIAVVSKVFPTRSHTVSAQGGINAALGNADGPDDWRWHMYDTVMGSDFLGDQEAIEYMCQQAPNTVYELEHMGMPFSRDKQGKIYQRAFGGQTKSFGGDLAHRTCASADRTGHALLHTLYQQNVQAKTNFYHEWYAVDLVPSTDGHIAGVIALCIETGELIFLKARATILATGGAGQIFKSTTNAYTNTGDGLGMVLRAGLPLQDMEMWQFHPTGIYGSGVLVSEGTRGEGGYLINKDGERYMARYAPHLKDLSCRDVVSRCSMMEILEKRGCGEKGDHMLLKLDHLGEEVLNNRLPGITALAKTFAGVDPAKDPIPVLPTCHYMMGGIPTNIHGQVMKLDHQGKDAIVQGLFAAGECACVSVHGANRLGANSLLEIVVFGRASGMYLSDMLKSGLAMPKTTDAEIDQALSRIHGWENREQGEDFHQIRTEMREVMQTSFGVFRSQDAMEEGLKQIKTLAERLKHAVLKDKTKSFNTAKIEALEMDNLMGIAFMTALSAEHRKESRGAHARVDFKERDDKNWHKHILSYLKGDLAYRSVNMQPKEAKPMALRERK